MAQELETPPDGNRPPKYKGHDQPYDVEQRLEQARIFLADEDRHRCLNFDRKLEEILDYLKEVENGDWAKDKKLLNHVKAMANASHDWHTNWMDAPPRETTCCDTSSIPPYSQRLIDANTSQKLQEAEEAMGVAGQMRADHPPFTVTRTDDHMEFLQEFTNDAYAEPGDVPDTEDLFKRENQAYGRALSQPSLIPLWLHRDKGLPHTGIKAVDEQPYYRATQIDEQRSSEAGPSDPRRFMVNGGNLPIGELTGDQWEVRRNQLILEKPDLGRPPEEIKKLEFEINELLNFQARNTAYGSIRNELQSKLRNVLPVELRQLAAAWDQSPEDISLRAAFEEPFDRWCKGFLYTGIKIRIPQDDPSGGNLQELGFSEGPQLLLPPDFEFPLGVEGLRDWEVAINVALSGNDIQRKLEEYHNMVPADVTLDTTIQEPALSRLYRVLKELQYPALRQEDTRWRVLSSSENATLKRQLKHRWLQNFFGWAASLDQPVEIIQATEDFRRMQYPPNDPSVVFYRGPVKALETSPSGTGSQLADVAGAPHIDTVPISPVSIKSPELAQRPTAIPPAGTGALWTELQDLLGKYNERGSLEADEQARLNDLINTYWPQGIKYRENLPKWQKQVDDGELSQVDLDRREGQYNLERQRFIDQSKKFGGVNILRLSDDRVVLQDAPAPIPHPLIGPKGKPSMSFLAVPWLAEELNQQWTKPKLFYLTLNRLEREINYFFNLVPTRAIEPCEPEVLINLTILLEPFYPDYIDPQSETFDQVFYRWIRVLRSNSVTTGRDIIIKVVDQNDTTAQSDKTSFAPAWPEIYFKPREVTVGSLTLAPTGPPEGFQRIQDRINELLAKFSNAAKRPSEESCQMTWEEDEELHCLLHVAMTPTFAKTDRELREMGVLFRAGLLDEGAQANYLARMSKCRDQYIKWVRSFANSRITLEALNSTTERNPNPQVLQIYMDKPWEIPDAIPKPEALAPPYASLEITLNYMLDQYLAGLHHPLEYSDAEVLDLADGRTSEPFWMTTNGKALKKLLRTSFKPTERAIQEALAEDLRSRSDPIDPESEEGLAYIRGVARSKFHTFVRNLQKSIKGDVGHPKSRIILEEIYRGYVTINQNFENHTSPLAHAALALVEQLPEGLSAESFETVSSKFLRVARDLRRHNFEAVNAADLDRIVVLLSSGTVASTAEEALYIRLWSAVFSNFPEILPDEVKSQILPKDRVKRLRKNIQTPALLTPPSSPGPFYPGEIEPVCRKISQMLREDVDNTNRELDFIIEPLLPGRLATIAREQETLNQKYAASPLSFSVADGIALSYYLHQFERELGRWKATTAQRGLVLGEVYTGPLVLEQVLKRYQAWTELSQSMGKVVTIPEDAQITDRQRHYHILEQWVLSPDNQEPEQLRLDLAPQDVRTMVDQIRTMSTTGAAPPPSPGQRVALRDLKSAIVQNYMAWYTGLSALELASAFGRTAVAFASDTTGTTDFTGKAERRGVQRAAIELALNLLATNSEQLRPHDKFRRVRIPSDPQPFPEEVPLRLPLAPHERPLEMPMYKYTNIMRKYRQRKDHDYQAARKQAIEACPSKIAPQENHLGPSTAKSYELLETELQERRRNLIDLQGDLNEAERLAPRPLIRRLLLRVNQGLQIKDTNSRQSLYDDEPLSSSDIAILQNIADPSWYYDVQEYPNSIPGINMEFFLEFSRDIQAVMSDIPFWEPNLVQPPAPDADEASQFQQHPYNRQEASMNTILLVDLLQRVNKMRLGIHEFAPPWSIEDAKRYLSIMHNADRIHFNAQEGVEAVARIPPSGHPENKYFESAIAAINSPFVKKKPDAEEYEIQYDKYGMTGPPIIQPNKYKYLQRIAFRLGRDIRQLTEQLARNPTQEDLNELQDDALQRAMNELKLITANESKAEEPTLQQLARDLHKIAPDLAAELGIRITDDPASLTEEQAAQMLQMQVIQECNNKWEPRFPEKENVWDFAAPRLEATRVLPRSERRVPVQPQQFFNMKRWPPACQRAETRTKIAEKGPLLLEKTKTVKSYIEEEKLQQELAQAGAEEGAGVIKERHTGRGQPPMYPFGETPYIQLWLSFRMEDDLKNVEEFNPKRPGVLGRITRSKPFKKYISPLSTLIPSTSLYNASSTDPLALPPLPAGWIPDSVTAREKAAAVSEDLISRPGFPDAPENYYTPAEVRLREQRIEQRKLAEEVRRAREAVEKSGWLEIDQDDLTREELRERQEWLGIDPFTGLFLKPDGREAAGRFRRPGFGSDEDVDAPPARRYNTRASPKKRAVVDAGTSQTPKRRRKARG